MAGDRMDRVALLAGLSLAMDVVQGSDAGGMFRNIPSCTQPRQVGCVVVFRSQVRLKASRTGDVPNVSEGLLAHAPKTDVGI